MSLYLCTRKRTIIHLYSSTPYYYKREINDLSGKGERVFRYEIRSEGVATLNDLAGEIHKRYRALGEGEAVGIVMTFLDAIKAALAAGRSVSLDEFGSFSLGIGLKDEDSMVTMHDDDDPGSEPNARSIGVKTVHFRASKRLVSDLNSRCRHNLHREPGGTAHLHRTQLTREERIQLAMKFIEDNNFMRLGDYAALVHVSRAVASRDLQDFVRDPAVPITTDGVHSHKIYVAAR